MQRGSTLSSEQALATIFYRQACLNLSQNKWRDIWRVFRRRGQWANGGHLGLGGTHPTGCRSQTTGLWIHPSLVQIGRRLDTQSAHKVFKRCRALAECEWEDHREVFSHRKLLLLHVTRYLGIVTWVPIRQVPNNRGQTCRSQGGHAGEPSKYGCESLRNGKARSDHSCVQRSVQTFHEAGEEEADKMLHNILMI